MGRVMGRRWDTESRANTALGGSSPRWEGKEGVVEWLHRKRCCAPGLWPRSGTRGAAQVWGFADPEPAEGSHGCALQDPDYRNLVGEKGWHGKTLSEREGERTRERKTEPDPCPDRLLSLFWARCFGMVLTECAQVHRR